MSLTLELPTDLELPELRAGEFVVRRYHGHAFEVISRGKENGPGWSYFGVRCVVCDELVRERTSHPLTWVRGHLLVVGPVVN